MNCQKRQEEMFDALAAGSAGLAPEVAEHQNSCPACAQFFAAQQTLFQSIDAGLHSVINQPVPPSLLPSVRARLNENPVPQRSLVTGWNLAGAAALAILALVLLSALHRRHAAVNSGQIAAISRQQTAAPQVVHGAATIQKEPKAARVLPPPIRGRDTRALPTGSRKVIVPAEERRAFARFVAAVPQQPEVALAFARPATIASDVPNETALLRIDLLDLKPLDGIETE